MTIVSKIGPNGEEKPFIRHVSAEGQDDGKKIMMDTTMETWTALHPVLNRLMTDFKTSHPNVLETLMQKQEQSTSHPNVLETLIQNQEKLEITEKTDDE